MGSPNSFILYFRDVHMYSSNGICVANPGEEIDFIEFADSINSHNPIKREQIIILRLHYPKWIPRSPAVH